MPAAQPPSNGDMKSGIASTAHALNAYLIEISSCHKLCVENETTTAIHTRGKELQIYRLFEAGRDIVETLERSGSTLPPWNEWPFWKSWSQSLQKIEDQVVARLTRHKQQREIFTRGVCWECRPVLIHAYKFEPDPILKIELVIPNTPIHGCPDELPLQVIASAVRCHNFLVPSVVALPHPPYTRHEAQFETLSEYLRRTMPTDTYASCITTHAAGDG